MTRMSVFACLPLSASLLASLATATSAADWLTDFAAAQKSARLSGKPIFAVLH